ncbi:hypothetical protein LTR53_004126 [Teratosphaeriaceae sp. CCFEE 6253]|nr:hypothetical protein LTR53_004126 [Teratosphaeriaceae sp. CCFEE 6253]
MVAVASPMVLARLPSALKTADVEVKTNVSDSDDVKPADVPAVVRPRPNPLATAAAKRTLAIQVMHKFTSGAHSAEHTELVSIDTVFVRNPDYRRLMSLCNRQHGAHAAKADVAKGRTEGTMVWILLPDGFKMGFNSARWNHGLKRAMLASTAKEPVRLMVVSRLV